MNNRMEKIRAKVAGILLNPNNRRTFAPSIVEETLNNY